MTVLPEEDPHGDRAWQEEQRQKRQQGRGAILDDAEDWRPSSPPPGDGDPPDGDDPDAPPPMKDHVTMPRFLGRTVRWVPISMPDDPPITCLGVNGRTYWYLSPLGQLVGLEDSEHGQAHIAGLWAPQINVLHRAFPQFDQSNRFKGFQAQYARDAMFAACANKGLFDAHDRVRGLGCWKDEDGQLVQHLGDKVLIGGTEHQPGEIGRYVYPGRNAIPPPKKGGKADCLAVYARIQKWNFERGELDARLLLGQTAAGVLGAAINWRPMAFMTGDAGTGKSTLQQLVRGLLDRRVIATVDASEAALRALLGQDALMVSFDEIEADAHNDKAQAVMKLARTSASGDHAHRSGSDQQARSFTLRGSFLFSAIIPPSMRQQDMQRFAFLRLKTLPKGAELPDLTEAELRDLGAGLVGRITGGWARWERTLQAFFRSLQQRGHEHRGAMQFGTMLAAAHILLEDEDPTVDDLALWCDQLQREGLFEYENSSPSWLNAWRRILVAYPDAWRGDGSPTVEDVVRRYLVARKMPDGKDTANKWLGKLNQVGLSIVSQRGGDKLFLAVSPKHSGMAAIFKGSDFEAKGGEGAWNIPLRGAPKMEEAGGVMRVDNVPRLGRLKCPMFWLDGVAVVAGQPVKIFDRDLVEDEVDAPIGDRLAQYLAAIAGAQSQKDLATIHKKAAEVRAELDGADLDLADGAFNARWAELEPPG